MTSFAWKLVSKLISECHIEIPGIHTMIKVILSGNLGNKRVGEKQKVTNYIINFI